MKTTINSLKFIVLLAYAICLTSCSSMRIEKTSFYIDPGMTKEQVLKLMGMPGNRQFKEDNEAWQWCQTDYWGTQGDSYIIIWFYKGYVTGMNSYKNLKHGDCTAFFQTLNWEDKPSDIIEIRHR